MYFEKKLKICSSKKLILVIKGLFLVTIPNIHFFCFFFYSFIYFFLNYQ
jgi:hypothetical protein